MAYVFLSHAGQDRELPEQLHYLLRGAGHEVFLDRHPDDGIPIGEDWRREVHNNLAEADALVCIVTRAFASSPWCAAEVGAADYIGLPVIPLLVEAGVQFSLLDHRQYVDLGSDPDKARSRLLSRLAEIDGGERTERQPSEWPFPGLRAFSRDMARVFFGRAADNRALARAVRRGASRRRGVVLAVVGPSGSGKSSLVRAGLAPTLEADGGWLIVPPVVPGSEPVAALAHALGRATTGGDQIWSKTDIDGALAAGGHSGAITTLLEKVSGKRLLLIVDQAEELFTRATTERRLAFARILADGAPAVSIVATLRSDSLDQMVSLSAEVSLPIEVFPLAPLDVGLLPSVIRGPARVAGIEVGDELVTRLVADTGDGGGLPLLAFTLNRLAAGVRRGERLTIERYEDLGGVGGSLVRQADEALSAAITAGRRDERAVLGGLLRLVAVDGHGRVTTGGVDRSALPPVMLTEMEEFVTRRLLTTGRSESDGALTVRVAHERFPSVWPPYARLITEFHAALLAVRSVEDAAADWSHAGEADSYLWNADRLAAARAARRPLELAVAPPRPADSVPLPERMPRGDEIAAAASPGDAALDSAQRDDPPLGRPPGDTPRPGEPASPHAAPQDGEVARPADPPATAGGARTPVLSERATAFLTAGERRTAASRRWTRRRRATAVGVLSCLLVLALIAAGLAVLARRDAERGERLALARALVLEADWIRATDPIRALVLGLAAYRLDPGVDQRASLLQTVTGTRFAGVLAGTEQGFSSSALSPAGDLLATTARDGEVALWDARAAGRPRRLATADARHTDASSNAVWSPDGTMLVTSGVDATVRLWEVTTAAGSGSPSLRQRSVLRPGAAVGGVALSPDGRFLAAGDDTGSIRLWDVTDRARPVPLCPPLTGQRHPVLTVAWSPDGKLLASGSSESVRLWDVADLASPRLLGELTDPEDGGSAYLPGTAIRALAWSPLGHTLAVGVLHGVDLWDTTDPARPTRIDTEGHVGGEVLTSDVWSLDWSPDGTLLAVTGSSVAVVVDVSRPAYAHITGPPLRGQNGRVTSVDWYADGRHLVTSGFDGTAVRWTRDAPGAPRLLTSTPQVFDEAVRGASVAPGRPLAALRRYDGNGHGFWELWEIVGHNLVRAGGTVIPGDAVDWPQIDWAPDGTAVAVFDSTSNMTVIWDVANPRVPRRIAALPHAAETGQPTPRGLRTAPPLGRPTAG